MIADLPEILHRLVNQQDTLQVRFPEPDVSVPELAYKVPFPGWKLSSMASLKSAVCRCLIAS